MTADPTRFLHALANLLSSTALYASHHPAHHRAFEAAWSALVALLEQDARPAFSFLEEDVIYGTEPLPELRGWSWGKRLGDVGVQRLEITDQVTAEELRGFVAEVARRLELGSEMGEPAAHPHIRYGTVGVMLSGHGDREAVGAGPPLELREESEAIAWIHERAAAGSVPTAEASVVVRALSLAMNDVRPLIAPLLEIKSTDQYTTAHCINVAILSMSLAEYLKFGDPEVRAIGEAALLHDIGKTRIPLDVLNKPGTLSEEERVVIERHPVEGARLLLDGRDRHPLAATVAYEHHMQFAGEGGYPSRHYARKPHRFSRLVQVCDVYDALRTRRPFRAPLSAEAALRFLKDRAGRDFDPELARAFADMMRQWEPRTIVHEQEGDLIETDGLTRLAGGPYDADTERDARRA